MSKDTIKVLAVIVIILFLSACSTAPMSEPTTYALEMVTSTQPMSTKTAKATISATIGTDTPKPTNTPKPTKTNTATMGPAATNIALPTDEQMQNLQNDGYQLFSSGSFTDDSGNTYIAYVLTNAGQSFYMTGDIPNVASWKLNFYKWDGAQTEFIGIAPVPPYERYSEEYPYSYNVINWEDFTEIPYGDLVQSDHETQQLLNMQGYRSDINQNGLPEFALLAVYCPFSCSSPELALHFLEVQVSPPFIKSLTAIPRGRFTPDKHATGIVHLADPLNFYADEHIEYFPGIGFDVWWIYEWDGERFVDVSARYADEYRAEVQPIVTSLQTHYGKPYSSSNDLDILKIYMLLEIPELSEEAINTLFELTDLDNWPGSEVQDRCWLQLVRAYGEQESKYGEDFGRILWAGYCMEQLSDCLTDFDWSNYDISYCQELLP